MRTSRNILADDTGAAFAETLVVLPLFAAALVAIVALNNMYSAKLEAKARGRRMAWLQADSGECPVASCSGGCGLAENAIRTGGLDEAITSEDGSLLGDVGGYLLGRSTNGVATAEAPMPNALGGGTTRQFGRTTLLCNTHERTGPNGNVLDDACANGLQSLEYAEEVCR